jgi:hypothetical protein
MPLNQTSFSPLTSFSGSISAYTSDNLSALEIVSSSLPAYQNTGWEYEIMSVPFSTTSSTQQSITDLTLTLQNNRKYIVEAYLAASSTVSTNGIRVGVSASLSAETYYVIEVPTSATAIGYSYSNTNLAASSPGNSISNYHFTHIKGVIITTATGVPTWAPTISSELAASTVALGPSIIYYRQY